MSNERINELLHEVGDRPLPRTSYESIRGHYVPYFTEDMHRLGAAIDHPPTWADLKASAGRAVPAGVAPDGDPTDDD